ncbi:MAG: glycosyltransferase family 2 protein, partial [Deltaproteobacteria bacterium]
VEQLAARISTTRYAPHNGLTKDRPSDLNATPFPEIDAGPAKGRHVLAVTCMKNEGPFILEWLAYHRAIGFTDFLVYTNDCDDGTDELLQALDRRGVLTHRINNNWKGQSPQKAALNLAITEDMYLKADWIVHFDTDEFINIKIGDGRLDDLFAAIPGATAFSLTWRTFGYNEVERYEDRPIIEQFTAASPTYIPKPHTAWGFKTLFRNNGVYAKLSCHRPTHPDPEKAASVVWVNGSGQIMPQSTAEKGWRNDITNIGYDLVQLNHYPLRSAESFLVKRQRGRALHVNRSIGRNYWIRNDWNDYLDDSILRNVPRMKAELARLKALKGIQALHESAVARHIEKIKALRDVEEFESILTETTSIKINALQRVAYSLMLDIADRGQ